MASSLAHQTGTQIDTGGRIMQACRVNTDYLKSTVADEKELVNDPMKYCMHKDEIAVSCGKPLIRDAAHYNTKQAYPGVVTTLGDIKNEVKVFIARLYAMKDPWTQGNLTTLINNVGRTPDNIKILNALRDFKPIGVAVGMAHAHPECGDTVAAVQVGGLRTVQNGPFEICTGDLVQVFFEDIEQICFDNTGKRRDTENLTDGQWNDLIIDENMGPLPHTDPWDKNIQDKDRSRKRYYDGGFKGMSNSAGRGKKTNCVSIKPYFPSREIGGDEYYGDKFRVFARAMSSAGPYMPVDLLISRCAM
jgi:hypothetical protein